MYTICKLYLYIKVYGTVSNYLGKIKCIQVLIELHSYAQL